MKPVNFPEVNSSYGSDQPAYVPLPAHRTYSQEGRVIFCWKLAWFERLQVLLTGRVWHEVLTFYNPLQPQKLGTRKPEM